MFSRDRFGMRIFRKKLVGLLWLLGYLLVAHPAVAKDSKQIVTLTALPASCVALHRGQLCFQDIRFTWVGDDDLNYCLYSDTHELLLSCGNGGKEAFIHEYSSETSEAFSLRVGVSGATVASVTVNTAWVYRTGKRSSSGWRLF